MVSIFQAAVIGGSNVECCKILLSLGADPHQLDEHGDTPFDSAKDYGKLKNCLESMNYPLCNLMIQALPIN
jgi:ankyrin repeat protein